LFIRENAQNDFMFDWQLMRRNVDDSKTSQKVENTRNTKERIERVSPIAQRNPGINARQALRKL